MRYEISQNSQVQNLSSEIEIEKEKARAAIEMARLEIKAAEDKFRSLLSEKDEEISKARSIAQTNEDEQVNTKLFFFYLLNFIIQGSKHGIT